MGHDHGHHHHHHEINEIFKVAVLTLSDKGAAGEREDKSGPLIQETIEKENYQVVDYRIIPDEQSLTEQTLITLCDDLKVDLGLLPSLNSDFLVSSALPSNATTT